MSLAQHSRGFWINWEGAHTQANTDVDFISLVDVTVGVFKTSDQFFDLIATEEKSPKAKLKKLYFKLQSEKKGLEIHWQQKNGNFILEIPLKSLGRTVTVHGEGSAVRLFFHVNHPPLVYYSEDDMDKTEMERTNKLGSNIPTGVLGDVEAISICCTGKEFANLQSCLHKEHYSLRFTSVKILDCHEQEDITTLIQIQKEACSFTDTDFELMYMMNALLSRGYKSISLYVQIRELLRESSQALQSILTNLQEVIKLIDSGVEVFLLNPREVLKQPHQYRQYQSSLLHSCRITPSRVLLDEAQSAKTNTLFHNYGLDDFLRVALIDDNGERLSFISAVDEENIYDAWICKHLTCVNLPGVKYDFLGCSNSQIKEHGCYMYKQSVTVRQNGQTSTRTASDIRKGVGDLEMIRCVPKYMARFGLALSSLQSKPKHVKRSWVQTIPDVEKGRDSSGKPYVFTDGVGRISQEAMAYFAVSKYKFVPGPVQPYSAERSLNHHSFHCK